MIAESIQVDKERGRVVAGDFEIFLVQDGCYRLDGGSMYGMVPKNIWSRIEKHDEMNRLYMAMNCLAARRGSQVFLADVGIGDKLDGKGKERFGIENEKNLICGLQELGITREMVTHVIPTHLHFDHAGWIMQNDGSLTFPNAGHYIQQEEWREALNPHMRFKDSYLLNYYGALKDTKNLILLDGDREIEENVWALATPGHSRGHQVVLFDGGDVKVAHFGDLAAMAAQIRLNWTCGFDRDPETTITHKAPILERALREKWLIVTAHDRDIRMGQMDMEKGKYILRKVL